VAVAHFGAYRTKGSHRIFSMRWPGDPRVNLQDDGSGKAKAYQVRQLLAAIDRLVEQQGKVQHRRLSDGQRPDEEVEEEGHQQGEEAVTDASKYAYRVEWSEEDQEHVGLCLELPSLSHLDKNPAKALAGIMKLAEQVVDDLADSGEQVPEPISTRRFTGDCRLRMPPELHRRLWIEAAQADVSLNSLMVKRLSDSLGR
jgi:predicted HicB family RNase H-like nuclease